MGDTVRRKGRKGWDMSEKRVVMRILGQVGEVVTGEWQELCSD